jgi:ribosomal protein S27E
VAHKQSKCKRGHSMTEANVYTRHDGYRECRKCIRIRRKRPNMIVVMCPDCRGHREIQRYISGRRNDDLVCQRCSQLRAKYGGGAVRVTEEHLDFWRERFSDREIREMWSAVSLYLEAA